MRRVPWSAVRPGQLREAVRPGARVVRAVERLPVRGVAQPEVGTAVHDEDIGPELLGDRGGLPVRQREKHDLVPGQNLGGGRLELPVGQRSQMRLERPQPLPGIGVPGQRPDLHPRVPQKQTQHFTPGIPTRPGHCRSYRHGPSSLMA